MFVSEATSDQSRLRSLVIISQLNDGASFANAEISEMRIASPDLHGVLN